MAYGIYLKLDQPQWRNGDFSDTNLLTGTIYSNRGKTTAFSLTGYTLNVLIYSNYSSSAHFSKTATIVSASAGTWSYAVADGEMIPPGVYLIELDLTKSGERMSTFPEEFHVSASPIT